MLQKIEDFVLELFSHKWAPFHSDNALSDPRFRYPGVYLIAYTDRDLEGITIEPGDVFYVGMSNNARGVRSRLKDFKTGLRTGKVHSGAMRFYRDFAHGRAFSELADGKKFFFACQSVECNSNKITATPDDWRCMGEVECAEKYAMAHIVDMTENLPDLNMRVARKREKQKITLNLRNP